MLGLRVLEAQVMTGIIIEISDRTGMLFYEIPITTVGPHRIDPDSPVFPNPPSELVFTRLSFLLRLVNGCPEVLKERNAIFRESAHHFFNVLKPLRK